MNEFIPVIGTLFGVLLGGAISFVVSKLRFEHERLLDQRSRVLNKLEEAHKILSVIDTNFHTVKSKISIKRSYDINFDDDPSNEYADLDQLKMIIAFYAPSLNDDLAKLDKETLNFGAYYGKTVTHKNMSDQDEKVIFNNIVKSAESITAFTEVLQNKLIIIADKYIEHKA